MVLVYIGSDDPTRGDSHGFTGIGQRLAQKLGGEFHYLEGAHLDKLYPGETSKKVALERYFADHKAPDIVLSRAWDEYAHWKKKPLMCITSINEFLASRYLGESINLVCHHLTPELLESEGKKFREHYPALPSPLIAVMMVRIKNAQDFAEKLVSKCAAYPEAAIFLCGSRRTPEINYNHLTEALTGVIKEQGLGQRIKLAGYDFNSLRAAGSDSFNPYVGLLQEADHVIVCGESLSLISEPLAAGKPVMVYETFEYRDLKKKGLTLHFNDCAARAPFETRKIEPVNITEKMAGTLARVFRRKAFWHNLNPFRWPKIRVPGKSTP